MQDEKPVPAKVSKPLGAHDAKRIAMSDRWIQRRPEHKSGQRGSGQVQALLVDAALGRIPNSTKHLTKMTTKVRHMILVGLSQALRIGFRLCSVLAREM